MQRVAQVSPQQLIGLWSRAGEPAGGVVVVQRLGGHGMVAAGPVGGGEAIEEGRVRRGGNLCAV